MGAPKDNKNALGNEGGAPSKYKEEYNEQAYKLCLLGATDAELADFFLVDVSTINNWKVAHVEFFDSLTRGKIIADAEVAGSFYKRAKGYEYDELTFEKIDNKVTLEVTSAGDIKADESYKKKVVTKHLPPDPGAALSWLKNRQPNKWRDKQDFDHTTNGKDIIISREDIEAKVQSLVKKLS